VFKYLLLPLILSSGLLIDLAQPPEYGKTCGYIKKHLDSTTIAQLKGLLGKTRIEDLANFMTEAANDSINYYAKQLDALRLGGPYKYAQFDSSIKPYHIELIAGIKKFQNVLYDIDKTREERIFALQVLIGLYTTKELPLNVAHILPRDEFIKSEIFLDDELPEDASPTAVQLYDAYKLGVRIAQAKGNRVMINAAVQRGYERAGMIMSNILFSMFVHIREQEHFKQTGEVVFNNGESHWGKILEPGQDPIYTQIPEPSFPGGYAHLDKFMNDHLYYPKNEWDKGIEGESKVTIVIEKDGSVSHINVIVRVSPGIDSAMVKAIKQFPKWEPGYLQLDGPPVRSQATIIQRFEIKLNQKRKDAFNISFVDNIKPAFPGGKAAFDRYIEDNINYTGPPYGRVTVYYTIKTSGKVENVKLLRKLSPAADAEVVRLMEQSPRWKPGLMYEKDTTEMGDTVSVWFKPRKKN
jgi:hypothetical protein